MFNQVVNVECWETNEEFKVVISSVEASQKISLHQLDVDFIEEDYNSSGATSGELEVIVEEGLITIQWNLLIN